MRFQFFRIFLFTVQLQCKLINTCSNLLFKFHLIITLSQLQKYIFKFCNYICKVQYKPYYPIYINKENFFPDQASMIQQLENIKKQQKNDDQKSKKKVSLIKKKTKPLVWSQLYQNVDIKHIVNINDIVFLNQNALKDPENNESMISAIFYFKMISKVALNQDYIAITLKKLDQNALPSQYYIQRLRSYGDVKYYNIANYLQNLKKQFSNFQDTQKNKQKTNYKSENFIIQQQMKMLEDTISKRKGKMYLIFFCQVCPGGVMLKKIIISTELLKQLGYNINQIALDFIKYKHIFFQIFTAKMYSTMMEASLSRYSSLTTTLMQKQSTPQQIQEDTTMYYQDEMIRKINVNGSIQEDLLSVKVKWTSPHPSLGVFEIQDVKQLNQPYISGNKKIKKIQLPTMQEELKSLQHLTKIDPSLLEQNKNRCCTFKLISQGNNSQRKGEN